MHEIYINSYTTVCENNDNTACDKVMMVLHFLIKNVEKISHFEKNVFTSVLLWKNKNISKTHKYFKTVKLAVVPKKIIMTKIISQRQNLQPLRPLKLVENIPIVDRTFFIKNSFQNDLLKLWQSYRPLYIIWGNIILAVSATPYHIDKYHSFSTRKPVLRAL
jgi:hypothetical protein